jgi:hypothetical protein
LLKKKKTRMAGRADRFSLMKCGTCKAFVKATERKRHPCWNKPAAAAPQLADGAAGGAFRGGNDDLLNGGFFHNDDEHMPAAAAVAAAGPLLGLGWGLPDGPLVLYERAVPLLQPPPELDKVYRISLQHANTSKLSRLGPAESARQWDLLVSTAREFGVRVCSFPLCSLTFLCYFNFIFFYICRAPSQQNRSALPHMRPSSRRHG